MDDKRSLLKAIVSGGYNYSAIVPIVGCVNEM